MTDSAQTQELIHAVEQALPRNWWRQRTLAAAQIEAGISTLIAVYNNPTAAVAAVEGLIHMGSSAVQP